jgi:DNA processing protein
LIKSTGGGEKMMYEYWFAQIASLSEWKKYQIRKKCGVGKDIFYIEETKLKEMKFLNEKDINTIMQAKKENRWEAQFKDLEKKNIHFIPFFSEMFPSKLRDIPQSPYALYVKGNLPKERNGSAAIVGARQCTVYGEKHALELGKILASHGVSVISGLARGIDGAGHRGALMGRGNTYAVLGCGVDVCYPREHRGLYADILESGGGIISEFSPGTAPLSRNFPIRNRIISGLSDIVLVIEARKKSGSLITADLALEQGRDVYALPGSVDSSLSQGCNQLIHQGAGVLLSPELILEELKIPVQSDRSKIDKNKKVLETEENIVYSRVCPYPKNLSQLSEETALPVRELLGSLVSLELKGYVKEVSKSHYIKIN